jgi:hypothetical protein
VHTYVQGEFHGGDRNGKGKLTVKSGWSWTGQFKNGKRTGKGVHISPSGEKLVGEWWQHAAPRYALCPPLDHRQNQTLVPII